MADVAAMLAEAFAEASAEDEGSVVAVAVAPAPAPAPAPGTGAPFSSAYATPMLNVIRFLGAVAITSPTNAFQVAWSQTAFAGSVADVTAAMQGVYALSTKHLAEVFYNLTEESRRYFHTQCLQLSDSVAKDMPELSLATALLRWLTQAGLPALQPFPESMAMNTAEILRKNYAAVDYACLVARPDDSNPEFQKMTHRIASLERELLAEQKKVKALQQQQQQQQPNGTLAVVESTSFSSSKYRIVAIALGSALFAAAILIALLATLYYKHSKTPVRLGGVPFTAPLAAAKPASASASSMKTALDVLSGVGGAGADLPGAVGRWGFQGLI